MSGANPAKKELVRRILLPYARAWGGSISLVAHGRTLGADDLVSGEDVFVAATGVTSGALLRGVRPDARGVETESIVMRSRSGTVRRIAAYHPSEKVRRLREEGER